MTLDSFAATPQPAPTGDGADVTALVIADLAARREAGTRKYGTPLRTHNGRRALVDAYQEALDLCVYLRQEIEEQREPESVDDGPAAGLVMDGLTEEEPEPAPAYVNDVDFDTLLAIAAKARAGGDLDGRERWLLEANGFGPDGRKAAAGIVDERVAPQA